MFIALAPGINFINILYEAFTCVDPKSVERYWQLDPKSLKRYWQLDAFGIYVRKVVRKHVDKVEPRSIKRYFKDRFDVTAISQNEDA